MGAFFTRYHGLDTSNDANYCFYLHSSIVANYTKPKHRPPPNPSARVTTKDLVHKEIMSNFRYDEQSELDEQPSLDEHQLDKAFSAPSSAGEMAFIDLQLLLPAHDNLTSGPFGTSLGASGFLSDDADAGRR